jgi:hypothetical protein
VWDACDGYGRRAPAGVYFISFRVHGMSAASSYTTTEKTILLK